MEAKEKALRDRRAELVGFLIERGEKPFFYFNLKNKTTFIHVSLGLINSLEHTWDNTDSGVESSSLWGHNSFDTWLRVDDKLSARGEDIAKELFLKHTEEGSGHMDFEQFRGYMDRGGHLAKEGEGSFDGETILRWEGWKAFLHDAVGDEGFDGEKGISEEGFVRFRSQLERISPLREEIIRINRGFLPDYLVKWRGIWNEVFNLALERNQDEVLFGDGDKVDVKKELRFIMNLVCGELYREDVLLEEMMRDWKFRSLMQELTQKSFKRHFVQSPSRFPNEVHKLEEIKEELEGGKREVEEEDDDLYGDDLYDEEVEFDGDDETKHFLQLSRKKLLAWIFRFTIKFMNHLFYGYILSLICYSGREKMKISNPLEKRVRLWKVLFRSFVRDGGKIFDLFEDIITDIADRGLLSSQTVESHDNGHTGTLEVF